MVVLGIIIVSSAGTFALGRLSALEPGAVFIEQRATVDGALTDTSEEKEIVPREDFLVPEGSGGVVASKSGTKYHFPWCAGARSIKDENKIFFESIGAAREAGYAPADNCKGLE